jgi:eukaryotic-like serine/threonine-protein kinase
MFCLLSGRLVHQGRTVNEQLLSAMTRPAPPLRSVAPDISVLVANVVDRALSFNKAMRWPDAARMQESVRHAYHDRTGASIATAPRLTVPESVENRTLPGHDALSRGLPTTVRPVARASSRFLGDRSRSLRALAAVGALAGIVAVGVALTGSGRGRPSPASAARPPGMQEVPMVPSGATTVPVASATTAPSPLPTAAVPGTGESAGTETSAESLSPLPEVAATDLPSATPPPTPSAGAKPPSAGKASCNPPYVINPTTGKKNWKVECL